MKKAKVMLIAIVVLSGVGGVLAFKAKMFNTLYCYRTVLSRGVCLTAITGSITLPNEGGKFYYYTTTNNALNCSFDPSCSSSAYFTTDEQ